MIWTKIHDNAFIIGVFLGGITIGALTQSALDKSTKLPWLHQQAVVAHQLQAVEIPKIKAIAGCQTVRADLNQEAAQGMNIDPSVIPNCPSLKSKPPVHK